MVMETRPPSTFIVSETNLLFEFLIISLDAPTQLGQINQALE